MKRCVALLSLLCAAGPLASCSGENVLPPTAPTPLDPTPAGVSYALTSVLTSVTGLPCLVGQLAPSIGGTEDAALFRVYRQGSKIRLIHGTAEYDGRLAGSDFTASAGIGFGWDAECADISLRTYDYLHETEIVGRFSDDDHTLTATKRTFVRHAERDDDVLTLAWTWRGTRQ